MGIDRRRISRPYRGVRTDEWTQRRFLRGTWPKLPRSNSSGDIWRTHRLIYGPDPIFSRFPTSNSRKRSLRVHAAGDVFFELLETHKAGHFFF